MHRRVAAVAFLCFAFSSRRASAEQPPVAVDAEALASSTYCTYVEAVADSQSAVMVSPQLFVTGGAVSGNDAPTGPTTTTVNPRVVAGASYSFSSLYRGLATRQAASAECARYRVFNKLLAFSMSRGSGSTAAAERAKLDVLEESLPRAQEILDEARAAVSESRITADELEVTMGRVDGLRALTAETRGKWRIAAGMMQAPKESLAELVAQRERTERATEEQAARIRQAQAWDISVRGGYDQIFGQNQALPVFGMVTLTFSPGFFWQRGADDRAETARVQAARKGLEAATVRAEETARQLRETARAERERLADVTVLLADLSRRHEELRKLEGNRAKASADVLWLGLVPLRAEHAFLRAHTAELAKVVGDGR
ncbi:MAG: hypothetical protein KF819_11065 [Labilithrix sp.]|nr:hypothetical protein [Labilithrix sp.]